MAQLQTIEKQAVTEAVTLWDRTKALSAKCEVRLHKYQADAMKIVKNPEFQTCTKYTVGGMVIFSPVGGAFGAASGLVVGSAAGLPPALLTFGLSIPIGAACGTASGCLLGTVAGGAAGGGTSLAVYKYRVQIKGKFKIVDVMVADAINGTKLKICAVKDQALVTAIDMKARTTAGIKNATSKAIKAAETAKTVASAKAGEAFTFATTTKTGVAATSAVAGGVVCGATGGGAGTLAGAAVGVIPAIFTFGLSIPVCATIGFCCGTVAGGSFGAVSGGALGYGGFKYRKELGDMKSNVAKKMKGIRAASTGGSDALEE
jgi:hypothetical protein